MDWSDGEILDAYIRKALSSYKSWQQAYDGRGAFDLDLLPEKQRMKLFPNLRTWEQKRAKVVELLLEKQAQQQITAALLAKHQQKQAENRQIELLKDLASERVSFELADQIMKNGHVNAQVSTQIARLVGWCELEKARKEGAFEPKAYFKSVSEYQNYLLQAMKQEWESDLLPPPKPRKYNYRVIDNKFRAYREGGNNWKVLLDGRQKNTNNQKRNRLMENIISKLYQRNRFNFDSGQWEAITNKVLPVEMHREYYQVYRFYLAQMDLKVYPKRNHRGALIEDTNAKRVGNPDGSLRPATKIEFVNTTDQPFCAAGEVIEIEPIDLEAFRRYITSPAFKAKNDIFRHGEAHDRRLNARQVHNTFPEKAHSVWSMDDYTINRHLTINGVVTVKRAKAYIVWEAATGIPIGMSVGYEANTLEMAKAALYDAICFTGYAAYEVELDGAPFKKGSEEHQWLNTIFKVVRYGTQPNSKYAEQFNDVMEDEYYQSLNGFLQRNMGGQLKDDSKNPQELRKQLAKILGIKPHEYPTLNLQDEIEALQLYRKYKCSQRYEKGKLTDRESGKWWKQPKQATQSREYFLRNSIQEKATKATPEFIAARFATLLEREEVRNQETGFTKAGTKYRFALPIDFLMDHAQQLPALKGAWSIRLGYLKSSFTGLKPYPEAVIDGNDVVSERAFIFDPTSTFVGTVSAIESTVRSVAEGGKRRLMQEVLKSEKERYQQLGEEARQISEELQFLDDEELEFVADHAHELKGNAPDYKELKTEAEEELERRRTGNNAYGRQSAPDYTFLDDDEDEDQTTEL